MKKSVFVTGATNGTGFAIAERFAREGYDVFIGSRDLARAEEAAAELMKLHDVKVYPVLTKIFDQDNVNDIFADIRARGYLLSALVLNAANLGIGQDTLTVDIKDFMEVINTNIGWNFMLAQAAARQMKEAGGGAIVFIGSNTAYRAVPDRVAYSTSKNGILGLMRTLALDLGKYNIRVNTVVAGMIKTIRWQTNYNNCRNALSNYTPLRDIAEFTDIANAAYFLASDQARNSTGAELTVDGGNMIQLYPILDE